MPQDYVILIHGLGRTSFSMRKPYRFLSSKGYCVLNFAYPSRQIAIAESAALLDRFIAKNCVDPTKRIHFLTHSLGGIVLRAYLNQHREKRLGRAVMLVPPNQGSELADKLKNLQLYKWLLGEAGQQLGTDGLPTRLGAIALEVGVIAATRSIYPYSSLIFGATNDGMVALERTKVEGMSDFLVVNQVHSFVMNSSEVLRQSDRFFQTGAFSSVVAKI